MFSVSTWHVFLYLYMRVKIDRLAAWLIWQQRPCQRISGIHPMGSHLGGFRPNHSYAIAGLGGSLTLWWWSRAGFWLPWCEFKRLVFHFKNSYKIWNCRRCQKLLWPLEAVYACEIQEDVYFCVRCRGQVNHPHPLQCGWLVSVFF